MESYCPLEFRDPRPLLAGSGQESLPARLTDSQLRQLLAIIQQVNTGIELEQVLDALYLSARRFVPCNRLGLALIDAEGKRATATWVRSDHPVVLSKGYQAPLAGSSLDQINKTGHVRIINDLNAYARDHPQSQSTRLLLQEGMRSSLTCPLFVRGQATGFLFFTSTIPHAYSGAEVAFYQQIASHVAVVIEKGRLYSDLSRFADQIQIQNKAIRRDLELAAQLQRTFIPENPPDIPGLDISLLYEPLAAVGGDLVELIPVDNSRLLVLVADAMGHGASAALAMAVVKATFFATINSGPLEPGTILSRLNHALPPLLKNHFAAALAMIIDAKSNHLCAARAALPPPIIVDAATGDTRALEEGGLPLTVDDTEPYSTTRVPFNPGDTIILTTDGLIEAHNETGHAYGLDRLLATATQCRHLSAAQSLQTIIDDLIIFRGLIPPSDDMSLVFIRRTP